MHSIRTEATSLGLLASLIVGLIGRGRLAVTVCFGCRSTVQGHKTHLRSIPTLATPTLACFVDNANAGTATPLI